MYTCAVDAALILPPLPLSLPQALIAGGGKNGFPMTISTMQLGVGLVYALFTWCVQTPMALSSQRALTEIPLAVFCALHLSRLSPPSPGATGLLGASPHLKIGLAPLRTGPRLTCDPSRP